MSKQCHILNAVLQKGGTVVQHSLRLCSVQCKVDQVCRLQLLLRVLRRLLAMLQIYRECVPAGHLSRARSQLGASAQSPTRCKHAALAARCASCALGRGHRHLALLLQPLQRDRSLRPARMPAIAAQRIPRHTQRAPGMGSAAATPVGQDVLTTGQSSYAPVGAGSSLTHTLCICSDDWDRLRTPGTALSEVPRLDTTARL